jgi:guanylate kinase
MEAERNKLIIFSAPSGSGKTTLVKYLMQELPSLEFSISATTRAPRGKEKNAQDYYFLSIDEFKSAIDQEAFVEWEEVYPNQFYGTLKSELQKIWDKRHIVVFDVDVVGGVNLKEYFKDQALALFIQAPSIDHLKQRLIERATDSSEQIDKRIAKARKEMEYANKFDQVIINDQLSTAQEELLKACKQFLMK